MEGMNDLYNNQNQEQNINNEEENKKRNSILKFILLMALCLLGLTILSFIVVFFLLESGGIIVGIVSLITFLFGWFELIYVFVNRKKLENFKKLFTSNIVVGFIIVVIIGLSPIGISVYRRINSVLTVAAKPIIYLYPEEETEIEVSLSNPEDITCSYPKYVDSWKVEAEPNGDLTYIKDGKKLYSLYYEAKAEVPYKVEEDGFIVKGEDVAEFLDEKLDILGLNYKEREEFIVYWLPKLEANKYNYIRFATEEEINENMKLEFSKEPDTLIRVLMTYKGLENPIEVKEQELKTPERKGFVAVEWGGSEIK